MSAKKKTTSKKTATKQAPASKAAAKKTTRKERRNEPAADVRRSKPVAAAGAGTLAADTSTYAEAEINLALTAERKIELLSQLMRIRRFEERSLRAYQQGKIGGFLHLYIGQESVAVGTCSLMREHDHVITAYRDHGHALAVGMTMNECMAELYGKHTGCSKGKGGSMHFFAPDKNYWGGHGIVGGQTPLGLGLAFGIKFNKQHGCCLCFMGDGAVNQGAVHESFNLANLWSLPVIYVIENNGYSMGTSQERSSAGSELYKRAEAYDMASDVINGNDLYEVRAKTWAAMQRAIRYARPTLLEIVTYRYRGHSVADANAEKYRTKEEIEDYKKNKDPITLFKNQLIAEKVITEDQAKDIDKSARQEAEDAASFADQSPYPPVESITEDVYYSEDNPSEKAKTGEQGRIFF